MLKNLFALIGLLALVAAIAIAVLLKDIDPQKRALFAQIAMKVVSEKKDPVDAMMESVTTPDTPPATTAMLKEVMNGVMAGGEPVDTMLAVMLKGFDEKAPAVYKEMMTQLLEHKDPAYGMIISVPVDEGISIDELKESMQSLASTHSMLFVGESPFYKQVEAVTGKPYRHVAFMSFCDASTGMLMANYNDMYTAFMPCTISVVEKADGTLWLYALNMDLMIHGGKEFPPELKQSAISVRDRLRKIMDGAAKGEF
jgi:hypothetical protein